MKKKYQIKTQREVSLRPDGKYNLWERIRGKFDWTAWVLIGVQEKETCDKN